MTSHANADAYVNANDNAAAVDVSTYAMLEDLRTLVEIESPSRDLAALAASAEAVATVTENRLGGHAVLIVNEGGTHVHWAPVASPACWSSVTTTRCSRSAPSPAAPSP